NDPTAPMDAETGGGASTGFAEKTFFEYHLYTLPRKTDVLANTTQQLTLFPTARGVGVEKVLVYYGLPEAAHFPIGRGVNFDRDRRRRRAQADVLRRGPPRARPHRELPDHAAQPQGRARPRGREGEPLPLDELGDRREERRVREAGRADDPVRGRGPAERVAERHLRGEVLLVGVGRLGRPSHPDEVASDTAS